MSLDAARQFYDKYQTDPAIKSAIDKCWEIEQTIAVAKQNGYDFSADEAFSVVGASAENAELSDQDLDMVSGGAPICCVNCSGPNV